jgi:uncharacterized phage infection (PIP) family protein YhgE
MDNYLKILEDSLIKKSKVLDDIAKYNEEQNTIFSQEKVDIDKFDEYVDKKGELIDALTQLDKGFETLYERVSEELKDNRAKYAEQISRLQTLVKEVTDKGVSVQAQEARNKALVEEYFARERRSLRDNRKSSKAAYDYYKTMSGTHSIPPQFLDSKQ